MTIRLVSAKVRVFHKCPTPLKVTTIRTIAGNESMYAWTDTNIYNEMGNPTLRFGLGGKKYAIRSEQIDIEEIFISA